MILPKKYQRYTLFLAFFATTFLFFPGAKVSAATNKLPDVPSGQFTNIGTSTQVGDVYLSVAAAGANYALDAPEATVKLFVKDDGRSQVTVRINNAAWCPNNFSPPGVNIDSLAGAPREFPDTAFIFFSATAGSASASEAMSVPLTFFGNASLDCNNPNPSVYRDPTITLNMSSLTPSAVPGHEGYRVVYIRAQNNGFVNGINGFSITAQAQDKLSYYAGSTNKFALGQLWLDPDRWADMRLQFAPSCSVTTPQDVDILWFDADAGVSNQTDTSGNPNTIATVLYEVSATGVRTPVNVWPLTGGNGVADSKRITVQPGKRYEWELQGVKSRNGIQFQLPYDSINFDQVCTPPPPNPTISCATPTVFTLSGSSTPEVGETFYSRVNISNSPSTAVTYTGGKASLTVSPVPTSGSPQSNIAIPNITGGSSVNVTSGPIVANTAGTYTIDWNVTGGNAGSISCPGTLSFRVASKPFFIVRGGDVAVGPSCPTTSPWYSATPSGTLTSWNNGVSGAGNLGAGTNLAALALGVIDGFATGQPTSGSSPVDELSFSNAAGNPTYGGGFLGGIPCPTDYYDTLKNATTSPIVGTIDVAAIVAAIGNNPAWYSNGPLTITTVSPAPIALGKRPIIYVNGDAYIDGTGTGKIKLAGGAATIEDMPNFYLVVKGNIYIAPGVSQLDGVYVAQPDSLGNRGKIYTCAFPDLLPGTWRPPNATNELNTTCKTTLTVKGTFVAKELKLYRSFGTLSANSPAEIFNASPATWLAAPCAIAGCGTAGSKGVDAITSLPPIL